MYFFFQIENIRFHGYDKNCHCQLQGGVESTEVIKSCDQALRIREEPRILCDRAEAQLAEVSLDLTEKVYLFSPFVYNFSLNCLFTFSTGLIRRGCE